MVEDKSVIKSLQDEVKALRKELTVLQDIEAIKKLEMAYGYLLEHLMVDEVADLWTDNGALEWTGLGVYKGKETIRHLWQTVKKHFAERNATIHMGARICGYVTVNPDGKTASARWYVAGGAMGVNMLCENTYVKENGVWKYNYLSVGGFPMDMGGSPDAAGMGAGGAAPVKPTPEEEEKKTQDYMGYYKFTERLSRCPRQEFEPWLRPFSFKHPVTGQDLNKTVQAWNKSHPCLMPPGGEKWVTKK
jgi:hypothetical protein